MKDFKRKPLDGYLNENDEKRMQMSKNMIFTGYKDDTFIKSKTLKEMREEQKSTNKYPSKP